MATGSESEPVRWRAPAQDGTALIAPSIADSSQLLENNRQLILAQARLEPFPGFAQLRSAVRADLIRLAEQYTQQYATVAQPAVASLTDPLPPPIIISGHQPDLFHPGVWFKNFVLSSLAQKHSGVAINLIIDNDTLRGSSLVVPTGTQQEPQREAVPYDNPLVEQPFEERRLIDAALWQSFPQRVSDTIRPLAASAGEPDYEPLVHQWHQLATAASLGNDKLGTRFAAGRHLLEVATGLRTWELPLSQLCQQTSFLQFMQQLLSDLPRLHEAYNLSLADYRRRNHLRSHSHPAPDLELADGWWEVPLWIWSSENPQRRRAFARHKGANIEIGDRQGTTLRMPTTEPCDPLAKWEKRGVKLRPRALLTTLFARLLACDLFIHGIGGAKYDEVTEQLAARLWNTKLPGHLTATATVRLPFYQPTIALTDIQSALRRIRDLHQHPQRFLPKHHAQAVKLQQTIENAEEKLSPKQRAQQLQLLKQQMATELQPQIAQARLALEQLQTTYSHEQLLASREFSFLLFSAGKLSTALLDLSSSSS